LSSTFCRWHRRGCRRCQRWQTFKGPANELDSPRQMSKTDPTDLCRSMRNSEPWWDRSFLRRRRMTFPFLAAFKTRWLPRPSQHCRRRLFVAASHPVHYRRSLHRATSAHLPDSSAKSSVVFRYICRRVLSVSNSPPVPDLPPPSSPSLPYHRCQFSSRPFQHIPVHVHHTLIASRLAGNPSLPSRHGLRSPRSPRSPQALPQSA